MKLTAVVVGIESAQKYTDNKERITLRIKEADAAWSDFRLRNEDGLQLNDILELVTEDICTAATR